MVIMDKDPVELGYKNVGKKTRMEKKDCLVFAGFLILMEGVGALMGMMTAPGGAMRPDDDWLVTVATVKVTTVTLMYKTCSELCFLHSFICKVITRFMQ